MTPEQKFEEAKAESANRFSEVRSVKIPLKASFYLGCVRDEAEAYRAMVSPELSFTELHELSLVKFSWEE